MTKVVILTDIEKMDALLKAAIIDVQQEIGVDMQKVNARVDRINDDITTLRAAIISVQRILEQLRDHFE